ncbi:MAG: hypothetical protein ACHP7A_03660 [Caulobacterales bacterium]|jgi:hypothetical protein
MYVFLSYQTSDKTAAGQVKALLAELKIEAFLAHEDIHVSHEWRTTILEEIGKATSTSGLNLSERYDTPGLPEQCS